MKTLLVSAIVISLLSACASNAPIPNPADYNPKEQARIRLYGQNSKPTFMRYTLDNKEIEVNVGGSMGQAFRSFIGAVDNESIGIPQTLISNNVKTQNKLLSTAFYKEFVVPSESTLRIRNSLITLANVNPGAGTVYYSPNCYSKEFSFQPEAGKDYEVASFANQRGCAVIVFEVKANGEIQPVTR